MLAVVECTNKNVYHYYVTVVPRAGVEMCVCVCV